MKGFNFSELLIEITAKTVFLSAILFIPVFGFAQYGIIPKPSSVKTRSGNFDLSKAGLCDPYSTGETNDFVKALESSTGKKLPVVANCPPGTPCITFAKMPHDSTHSKECYHISVTETEIKIKTNSAVGRSYAFQTLLQLIQTSGNQLRVPCVDIDDEPVYAWRGMHLDVSRHFFSKDEVKRYLDYLAIYKMNVFHWHLTDDQGWRVEIKKYPLLTKVGAWRNGSQIGAYDKQQFDSVPYGGYYTQEDIKEMVQYASERHITIVPEIEMPGHAVAALAAYPQYSCTGAKLEVAKGWGVFEDVYCPKEETFQFLFDVLDEVCGLFPGKYIHIGGDECPKTRWKACENCQRRIKDEKLKDEHELQSYFVRRIEKHLNNKGRQIIGWDEILEGGLAPHAAVMSWRGTAGGVAAAREKHSVVMTPGKPCYFDHYQSTAIQSEPLAIGGYNPLDSVYAFNPCPPELKPAEKKYILGAQGNVWTEYITTFPQVEYMSLPRMCALSEALWSGPENKNYPDFIFRLKLHTKILDKTGVNYAKHFLQR